MAKITRVVAKIFGSGAGVNQIAQFGSLFAGAPAFTTDPVQVQNLSNWLTGWFAAAIGGNSPAIEDMNAVMYVYAYQLAYLMQAGVAEWDATTTYYTGSLVNDGSGAIYVSRTDGNINHLVSDATYWKLVSGNVMTALGDTIYGAVNGGLARLAGNTDAVRKYLVQLGDGLGTSAAPSWRQIQEIDIGGRSHWFGYHQGGIWNRAGTALAAPVASAGGSLVEQENTNFGTVVTLASGGNSLPGIIVEPTLLGKYRVQASAIVTGNTLAAQLAAGLTPDAGGSYLDTKSFRCPGVNFSQELVLRGCVDIQGPTTLQLFLAAGAGTAEISPQSAVASHIVSWDLEYIG